MSMRMGLSTISIIVPCCESFWAYPRASLVKCPVVTSIPLAALEVMTAEWSFWTTGRPMLPFGLCLHSTTMRRGVPDTGS
jgi:hypothetical protein